MRRAAVVSRCQVKRAPAQNKEQASSGNTARFVPSNPLSQVTQLSAYRPQTPATVGEMPPVVKQRPPTRFQRNALPESFRTRTT